MRTLLTQIQLILDFRFRLHKANAFIVSHKSSIVNYFIGFDTLC